MTSPLKKKRSKRNNAENIVRREILTRPGKAVWVKKESHVRVSEGGGFYGRLKGKSEKTFASIARSCIQWINPIHKISSDDMYDAITQSFAEIESHRPLCRLSKDGKFAYTPLKNTRLPRNGHALAGEVNVYTDKETTPLKAVQTTLFTTPPQSPRKKLCFDSPNTTAHKVQAELDAASSKNQSKTMSFTVTKIDYDAKQKRHLILGSRREHDQRTTMGRSAREDLLDPKKMNELRKKCPYLYKVIGSSNFRAEWLHLICHKIKGRDGQIAANLVNSTKELNTAMHCIESQIPKLVEAYPLGFRLKVTAKLVDDTDISSRIMYEIITSDFHLKFNFACIVLNRPSVDAIQYFKKIFNTLLESVGKKPKPSTVKNVK